MTKTSRKMKAHGYFVCLLAEFIGTFMLVFVDGGLGILSKIQPDQVSLAVRSFAPGLTVLAVIFALGELSGAHINPAVSLGFAIRGVFPWKRLPEYWGIQLVGALAAAGVLRAIFGNAGDLGATLPSGSLASAFAVEALLTLFLALTILSVSHQSKIRGPEAGFPVMAVLIACSFFGKLLTGASMNPARSFGPAVVSGNTEALWLYFAAPALGAAMAAGLVYLLQGPPKRKDIGAAQGDKVAQGRV